MEPEDLPRAVLAIFVVLVIALALGSEILNTDLTALIDPLTEIFVPIFLLAIFIVLIWAVISSFA
jgi:polyferredoxin